MLAALRRPLGSLVTVLACVVAVVAPLACAGDEAPPAEPAVASEDDVKVDTSTREARAQYDANIAFAKAYQPRCTSPSSGTRPRVLLTGFGRFMSVTDNATGRMLASLVPSAPYPETSAPAPGQVDPPAPQLSVGEATWELPGVGEVDVCALILPVYWDLASVLIAREIQAFSPDLVVMNGVYPGATWLTLELGTINRAVAAEDGSGNLRPVGGDGSPGFWGEAPLLEGLPPADDARGLLLSYDEVRAAAEASRLTHEGEVAGGVSFGELMDSVKYGGFPRDNTYLCNNTAYVTSYLLDHPGVTVPLLRASKPVKGKTNSLKTRVDFDGRAVPRVFVHWPDALVNGHIEAGADVLRAIVGAQLTAATPAVRGDNAWADPSLAGEPRETAPPAPLAVATISAAWEADAAGGHCARRRASARSRASPRTARGSGRRRPPRSQASATP